MHIGDWVTIPTGQRWEGELAVITGREQRHPDSPEYWTLRIDAPGEDYHGETTTIAVSYLGEATLRYLSRTEVAERIGVAPDTLSRYNLPQPDALTGSTRGWRPSTIDTWQANRPGPGARTDLT